MKRYTPALLTVLAVVLSVGCAPNPYLKGFTGQVGVPNPEDAPVAVIGANRADPLQMRDFDHALADAQSKQRMLGTSTIVSSTPLRDAEAAAAGRALGASLVLYSFVYLDSTVERDTQEFRRYSSIDNEHTYDRRSYDTTRHWYEYRAYFFKAAGSGADTGVPQTDP